MKDVGLKGPFAVTTFHSIPLQRSLEYGKDKGYGPDALLDDRYKFNPKAQAAIWCIHTLDPNWLQNRYLAANTLIALAILIYHESRATVKGSQVKKNVKSTSRSGQKDLEWRILAISFKLRKL